MARQFRVDLIGQRPHAFQRGTLRQFLLLAQCIHGLRGRENEERENHGGGQKNDRAECPLDMPSPNTHPRTLSDRRFGARGDRIHSGARVTSALIYSMD